MLTGHAVPLDDLLRRRLGLRGSVSGPGPLALFLRVPSWLGNLHRHPENCEAPLDLGYAAALARRAGWRAAVLDLETGAYALPEVAACLRTERPALVALAGITPATPEVLWLARAARDAAPAAVIVACGQHADAVPGSLLFPGSPIDLCTRGEFEHTLAAVLAAIAAGGDPAVPGTASLAEGVVRPNGERPPIADLDALPVPTHEFFVGPRYRHLHPMRALGPFRWGFVQGSRGCPCSCIYCSKTLRTSFGPRFRARSAESIVDEMALLARRGVNVLGFTDDVFNLDRARVLELCDAIRRRGVRLAWKAQGRAVPADLELFRAMRAAGCSTFSIGVESGAPGVLERLEKRVTVPEIEAAFRHARAAGLITVAFFMVGCPGETAADFAETLALMRRLDPDMVQCANFTAYPGSSAYARLAAGGDDWRAFQHYETARNLSAEPDEVMRGWQRRLYREFLLRPAFVARYLRLRHVNLLLNLGAERYLVTQALRSVLWPA